MSRLLASVLTVVEREAARARGRTERRSTHPPLDDQNCYYPGHKEGGMAKSKRRFGQGVRRPSPVDVHVGEQVRLRRNQLGLTQTDLGDAIGLTFQQVQKYERGANRISASRLFGLSRVLVVNILYFFYDLSYAVSASSPAQGGGVGWQEKGPAGVGHHEVLPVSP